MNKKTLKIFLGLLVGFFLILAKPTYAIMPPVFIYDIGIQIAQAFSVVVLFFTVLLGTLFHFLKAKYQSIKYKKTFWILLVFGVLLVSLVSAFFYAQHKKAIEYEKWKNNSGLYDFNLMFQVDSDNDGLSDWEEEKFGTDPNNPDTDGDGFLDGEEVKNGYNPKGLEEVEEENINQDENDQLNIGMKNNQNIDTSNVKFVSMIGEGDKVAQFISQYYKNIAYGNLLQAYEMSKQSVDFQTFQGWYAETSKITLDKLVRIDQSKSSIELTLYESESFTRYGVLMTLGFENSLPIRVDKSEVKILAQGSIQNQEVLVDEAKTSQEYDFYTKNQSKNIVITNQEFENIINGQVSNYLVLDAREDLEYENGFFPGSSHIRYADIKAGRWIELPKDKFIYVICWSGIRGKEVAEFLRTKKIVASYLESGANGWVEFGGKWVDGINFSEKYTDAKYQTLFTTNEVKDQVRQGVILVDTREPYKYNQWHIAGTFNIATMYIPTINLESAFNQIPANSTVITVCDNYVNCFDAKITGVELEQRGHTFLGRYNKPWEYES